MSYFLFRKSFNFLNNFYEEEKYINKLLIGCIMEIIYYLY